jgi:aminoglycoside 2''-phosphotransferase
MDFEAVVRENHPELDVRSFDRITGGWASDTFLVNGEYIFRFPKMPILTRYGYDIRKEIRLLPPLSKAMSVRVPVFEFVNEEIPYVGYKMIEGVPITKCDLGSDELAGQMAAVLLEIHSFPEEKALELGVLKPDWRMDYVDFYEKVQNETFGFLDEATRAGARKVFDGFLDNEDNFNFKPRLVHRDLSGDAHILCDTETDRIAGIIDWEDACVGDPAIDFTGLYWDCGEEFTLAVLRHYETLGGKRPDPAFWERNIFYRRIGDFYTIIYGLEIDDESYIKKGVVEVSKKFT